ncbi:hypothetical protein K2X05_06000 [bacterium]|nr:hypothetical protein [bacterium]
MNFISLIISILFVCNANASVASFTPGTEKISGVTLSTNAVVSVNGADVTLTNVGSGLRKKYIAILGTAVYVAQIFATQPEKYVKSNVDNQALDSLKDQTATLVKLDFVYNVSADKVYTAFQDALTTNQVDLSAPEIAEFLSQVQNGGDAAKGTSMLFVMFKNNDGTETLIYEDPAGTAKEIKGPVGFFIEVLSMWLGKISSNDKGLKELKVQLTK